MAALASNLQNQWIILYSAREFGERARTAAAREIAGEPIIDLVHLARQTLSDQALEVELLDLFERQSARIVAQLLDMRDADAKILRRSRPYAERLGAVNRRRPHGAATAQLYETACVSGLRGGALSATLNALADAVAEARATIAQLWGRAAHACGSNGAV